MRVQKNRHAPRLERANQVAHLAPPNRIERRGRLVQQHQIWLVDDGLGQPDALSHALRIAVNAIVAAPTQSDQLEHARDSLASLRWSESGQAGMKLE